MTNGYYREEDDAMRNIAQRQRTQLFKIRTTQRAVRDKFCKELNCTPVSLTLPSTGTTSYLVEPWLGTRQYAGRRKGIRTYSYRNKEIKFKAFSKVLAAADEDLDTHAFIICSPPVIKVHVGRCRWQEPLAAWSGQQLS